LDITIDFLILYKKEMEKEFVPYELAVKLKALGFDKPCFGYFDNEGELILNSHTNNYMQRFRYSAPTLSQAFRWFREKYGLQHDITLSVDNTNQLVGFYIVIHKLDPLWNEDQSIELEVNTTDREEAELACLDKLIEIVEK